MRSKQVDLESSNHKIGNFTPLPKMVEYKILQLARSSKYHRFKWQTLKYNDTQTNDVKITMVITQPI